MVHKGNLISGDQVMASPELAASFDAFYVFNDVDHIRIVVCGTSFFHLIGHRLI